MWQWHDLQVHHHRTFVQEHIMKHYNAPRLVAVGSVVEHTQGAFVGNADGGANEIPYPAGSVGFNL
jgi:hypothetical protein